MTPDSLQPQSSAPHFLLLEPVHLRLYGADASLSKNIHRHRSPKARETGDPIHNTGDASFKESSADRSSVEHPPGCRGGEGQDGGSFRSRQRFASGVRETLPFAPPAMSARCQVHPCTMQTLGVSPGDPMLAFLLLEGGMKLLSSNRGNTARSVSPRSIHQETYGRKARDMYSVLNLPDVGVASDVYVSGDGTQGQRSVGENTKGVEALEGCTAGCLDGGKIADTARCFLCRVWSNPHLREDAVAIDGRVKVPLNADGQGLLQSLERGVALEGENISRRPDTDDLLSSFLKALYVECEGGSIIDPVVGVFPLLNSMNVQGGALPLGARVAARMPSKPATVSGLPPEYTSMIKHSMRHLVVSDGCEVVVPALPNPNAFVEDEQATPAFKRDQGSSMSNCDGTTLVRIGPFSKSSGIGLGVSSVEHRLRAGQHGGKKREGPLSAFLRGAVCVITPDTTLLVEAEVMDAPEHHREKSWDRGKGGEGQEGEGRDVTP